MNVTDFDEAIQSYASNSPTFGDNIEVSDHSNLNNKSHSNLGWAYQLPNNMTIYSTEAYSYLAGSNYYWQTTEIEVYRLTPFIAYSVSFLHNGSLFTILLI